MSAVLVIGDLALTENVEELTTEIDSRSGGKVPKNIAEHEDAKGISGKFFFQIAGDVGYVQRETTVSNWENTTRSLLVQPGYEHEPFFWTVLGLIPEAADVSQAGLETNRFLPWTQTILPNTEYTLLVYVFHPLLDEWDPGTCYLRLSSYPEIVTNYPLDALVDSPYDAKRWRFMIRPQLTYGAARGWLRIGPLGSRSEVASADGTVDAGKDPRSLPPTWEIDLPIKIAFSRPKFVLKTVVLGLLLSAPGVIGIWLQQTPPLWAKIVASTVGVAAGCGAALLAALGIKRAI